MKELKKKAEQYAIEAKQTAQRLSAENFKLKEDLRREQHFNELTRKNMMTVSLPLCYIDIGICDRAWENRPLCYNFRFRDIGTTL